MGTLPECYEHVQYVHVHMGTLPECYAQVKYIHLHMGTLPERYAHVQYNICVLVRTHTYSTNM